MRCDLIDCLISSYPMHTRGDIVNKLSVLKLFRIILTGVCVVQMSGKIPVGDHWHGLLSIALTSRH